MAQQTIHYSETLEALLKREGERALALRWAHEAAQRHCAGWDRYIQIPSIILSFLSGTGAVGADTLLPFQGGMQLVGFISVFVGILGSIQSYLEFARRAEAHRNAALSFEKIHRMLSVELSLPRCERKPASELIDLLKKEIDVLAESSPLLPSAVKLAFKEQFHDLSGVSLPPILNGLEPLQVAVEIAAAPATPRPVIRFAAV